MVVIPSEGDHGAAETGYYKATDIGKQGNPYFFSETSIWSFENRKPGVEETYSIAVHKHIEFPTIFVGYKVWNRAMTINVQFIRIWPKARRPDVMYLGREPEEEYTRTKNRNRIGLQEIKMAIQTRAVVHLTTLIAAIEVVQWKLKVITEFYR